MRTRLRRLSMEVCRVVWRSTSSTLELILVRGVDEDEHARALEDQWMEGLTGQNEAAAETCASASPIPAGSVLTLSRSQRRKESTVRSFKVYVADSSSRSSSSSSSAPQSSPRGEPTAIVQHLENCDADASLTGCR